jgi:predicted kinase
MEWRRAVAHMADRGASNPARTSCHDRGVTSPTLIVVSGPAGSGKTTLAHQIARAVGCPAICRDEIKEGMVHATPGFTPSPSDELTMRTFELFFEVLGVLVRAGVTVVAEAAFQDKLWRPRLAALAELAAIRIVRCVVDPAVAQARIAQRAEGDVLRGAHADQELLRALAAGEMSLAAFQHISLPVPSMDVDTSDGYRPGLAEIVAFVNGD